MCTHYKSIHIQCNCCGGAKGKVTLAPCNISGVIDIGIISAPFLCTLVPSYIMQWEINDMDNYYVVLAIVCFHAIYNLLVIILVCTTNNY